LSGQFLVAFKGVQVELAELMKHRYLALDLPHQRAQSTMTTPNGNSTLPRNDLTTPFAAPGKRKRSESVDELSSITTAGPAKQSTAFSKRLQNALPVLRKYEIPYIVVSSS
jgi:hypothetical protein